MLMDGGPRGDGGGVVRPASEERDMLAQKGGIIKRQRKEFQHGGELPEDRASLLTNGRRAGHMRFDD